MRSTAGCAYRWTDDNPPVSADICSSAWTRPISTFAEEADASVGEGCLGATVAGTRLPLSSGDGIRSMPPVWIVSMTTRA